jgi:CHAT domain-containing protein
LKALFFILSFFLIQLAEAMEMSSPSDTLLITRAKAFYDEGKYDSSISCCHYYLDIVAFRSGSSHTRNQMLKKEDVLHLEALLYLGSSWNMLSQPDTALTAIETGIRMIGSFPGEFSEIMPMFLCQAGNAWVQKMDYRKSVTYYQDALACNPGDDSFKLNIYQNLGGIYFFREDYDNALEKYQKALVIHSAIKPNDPVKTCELLMNIGSVFFQKTQYNDAMNYFLKASQVLSLASTAEPKLKARLALDLGKLFMKTGKMVDALGQFTRAQDILKREQHSNGNELILLYENLAQLCNIKRQYDSAIQYLEMALPLAGGDSDRGLLARAHLYTCMGESFALRKQWGTSILYYNKSKDLLLRIDPGIKEDTRLQSLNPIVSLDLFRISQNRALALFREGIEKDSAELTRQSFLEFLSILRYVTKFNNEMGREGSKLIFNESVKDLYYRAMESGYRLLSPGHPELDQQIFLLNDRSRNKILLNAYMDRLSQKFSEIPDSLIIEENRLNEEILMCYRNLVTRQSEFPGERYLYYLDHLLEVRQGIDSAKSKCSEAISAPNNVLKKEVQINSLAEIRYRLMKDEALLEYFTGDSSVFIFVVTTDSLIIKRIPLTIMLRAEIDRFNSELRMAENQNSSETGSFLYRELIQPIRSALVEIEKLIIIPDESLATIPFEALVTNHGRHGTVTADDRPAFLVSDFEITYHFSAELWALSKKKERIDLHALNYGGYAPVIFSDDKKKNPVNITEKELNALPFSLEEVKSVSDLVREKGGKSHLFIRDHATVKNFLSNQKKFSIIHIATHSVINNTNPGFSGLVFYQEDEKKTNSFPNGFLNMDEIYDLHLNADLLVLSACATGTGKMTRSEGVMAMTRGFFMAGTSNIIYTLWNVTDRHTRDFMVSFFTNCLAGQTFSAALRNAKLRMIRDPATSIPCIWAPYVLLGN